MPIHFLHPHKIT